MYNECFINEELCTSMKQGLITLIPKPGKDLLSLDNWRPITLLNLDYKILSLVFAKRLKSGLCEISNESQTGFMPKRHISCNIRLILDLIDYAAHIKSEAVILFLDFYKAFDTIEHNFIFSTLELFGFGEKFIKMVKIIYKDINSSVLLQFDTSTRFPINRGVRQGCRISPFLFLLVVELLSLNIRNNPDIKGLSIFDREIRISQLADDTTLFLKNTNQVAGVLETIDSFTQASGLKLNIPKCEILCLYDSLETSANDIPIKDNVKYLGIYVVKKISLRQEMNFLPKIKKSKTNIRQLASKRFILSWQSSFNKS